MHPKRAASVATVVAPKTRVNAGRKRRMNDDEDLESVPVTKKMKHTGQGSTSKASSKSTTKKTTSSKPSIKKITRSTILKSAAVPAHTSVKAGTSRASTNSTSTSKSTKPKRNVAPEAPPKPKKVADPIRKTKIGVKINSAPTKALDVFVFGDGSAGELGLGHKRIDDRDVIHVTHPLLNPLLSAEDVGVVQIACGGMHVLALTKDNKILSWGVNDQGALGRDTSGQGEDSGSDSSSSGLNQLESTPAEIDTKDVAPGTKFAQVAASDSASFALTEDGRVYSWGTFRNGDGILGFSKDVLIQQRPVLLDEPRKVVSLATGSNHVLALDVKGKVQTWGAPEQCQLGRRVVQRDAKASALRPGGLAFQRGVRVVRVAAGAYHSFAVDDEGRAWAWGLNNYGQLGVAPTLPGGPGPGADEADGAVVLEPALVEGPQLAGRRVADVAGGEHHSLLVAGDDGAVLAFGRADGHQLGLPRGHHTPENSIYDDRGRPRVLLRPGRLDLPPVARGDAGTDSSLVVTREGRVYAWGFNDNYQCGVGDTDGDVLSPALLDSASIRDRKIVYAGCGGQFGVLASVHE